MSVDQCVQSRFEDRHLTVRKRLNLLAVGIDANDSVAEVGEAGARHEPHITCSNDAQAHFYTPFVLFFLTPARRDLRIAVLSCSERASSSRRRFFRCPTRTVSARSSRSWLGVHH